MIIFVIFLRNDVSGTNSRCFSQWQCISALIHLFSAGLYCLLWLVKCWACFTVLQMKKCPEALNYSWDGSQQTLNSTWGNPAVTLQLILLLNPAAKPARVRVCVCVLFLCFLYLPEISEEALTHTSLSHKWQVSPSAASRILAHWFGTQNLALDWVYTLCTKTKSQLLEWNTRCKMSEWWSTMASYQINEYCAFVDFSVLFVTWLLVLCVYQLKMLLL